MIRLFQRKVTQNSKEDLYKRKKPKSYAVESPLIDAFTNTTDTRVVQIHVIFLHIGEIDTRNELYKRDIYFEAKWTDRIEFSSLNLNPEQESKLLNDNLRIRLNALDPNRHWTPQLFIDNVIDKVSEQEVRVQGKFWEKLELDHFPADVQDLSISISTRHHIDHCLLIPDDKARSSINDEAFSNQQEWKLYKHVATEVRQVQEEYSFNYENDGLAQRIRPIISATCRAARQPGYFYFNGFCLIFLITVCSFCTFSITPDVPQSRVALTFTLLLASITFRWAVNQSLPRISYLTSLDRYAIVSIAYLVVLSAWHSIIGTVIFLNPKANSTRISPTDYYIFVDRYVFFSLLGVYILLQLWFILWLAFVPYKRRREMHYLDREYVKNKYIQYDSNRQQCSRL